MLFLLGGLFTGIGAVIIMQGAIIGERQSGTAAWVLSKPLARPAFVLSKLLANAFGMLTTAIVVPGVVGYVLCAVAGGPALGVGQFALGLGFWFLHILFYICLALMLGTLFDGRGAVAGIGIAVLLGPQLIKDVFPQLMQVTPMWLVMPFGTRDTATSLAAAAVSGQALPATLPILFTVGWSVLFLAVALWRFARQEF
jgi:ABC-2 type transport system permease protein